MKRRILELYAEHGYIYPDTAIVAFHRGLFDLLEQHLARDPAERQAPIVSVARAARRSRASRQSTLRGTPDRVESAVAIDEGFLRDA